MTIARILLPTLLAAATGLPASPPTADEPGEVSEVRIASEGGRTAITIVARGAVRVREFLLDDPPRLIVDVEGARHALPGHVYDEVARGAVRRLRTSQFRRDVVRLVFDLTASHAYHVERSGGEVTLLLDDAGGPFATWSTAASRSRLAEDSAPAHGPALVSRSEPSSGSRALAASSPPPGAVRQAGQPRISVTYDSAPVLEVLAGFAEFSGISIVPGSGVADRTVRGVEINDKPWDVALDAILQAQGLGWRRVEGDILLVDDLASLQGRDTLQTETRVLRINYAGADSVARVLEQLASERGDVVPYRGTNSIIVTDAPPIVARMDSLVRVLDKRTPQVSIEARIVFVDRTNVQSLGIGYNLRDDDGSASAISDELAEGGVADGDGTPDGDGTTAGDGSDPPRVDLTGDALSTLANAAGRLPGASLQILAATAFGDFSLFAFLDALATRELTDVQAAPTIQVVDNEQARIQVGDDIPIRVLERGAQAERAQATVRFEPTGVILEVTPHVTNNNQVLLDIRAERSGVSLGQPDVGFTVNRQIGETRVLVDNGETAVIGGLTRSELTESTSGIPGLMNIPIVGGLFRTRQRQEFKEDLIILVTPHVTAATLDATAP